MRPPSRWTTAPTPDANRSALRSVDRGLLLALTLIGVMVVAVVASSPTTVEGHTAVINDEAVEPEPAVDRVERIAWFLEDYCLDCHNAFEATADFNAEALPVDDLGDPDPTWDSAIWEKVLRRIDSRQMPPVDAASRPDDTEYREVVEALAGCLDDRAARHPRPGRTETLRRLTRTEYRNAIRDLLELEVDPKQLLPIDEPSYGFDNVTVSELSPTLLGRYLDAAERIARMAVGAVGREPDGITYRLPPDRTQQRHVDGLPYGTRGGGAFHHPFPRTGTYEFQLRLTRDRDERIEGLSRPHPIDVLIDRQRVHQFVAEPARGGQDANDVDSGLRVRLDVPAGPHEVIVTFPSREASLDEIKRQPFEARFNRHRHPRRYPALYELSIVGPFDPEGHDDPNGRRAIFNRRLDGPEDERTCAEEILRPLMRRAYRRPITPKDLDAPLRLFEEAAAVDGFEAGIERALAAVLVSPNFLFRIERDPPEADSGTIYPIDDFAMASRLAFFLWSSLPDDRLLDQAESGRLGEPETLAAEIRRMLADPRSEALVTNFAAQWLYLRNLETIQPDLRQFPSFDDNLRYAMRRETELLFESVMREDRSVLTLLQADYTFLNQRLATHYGRNDIKGSRFRRVSLDPSSRRGGLLRHGSILLVTSYATRTSPTVRGNWVLENILGSPPPPPPPNVPDLPEKGEVADLSVRERLAEHRANPACASCHRLIDPIGFALENYDAVGRWRDLEGETLIDASGVLPDGTEVRGIEDLEGAILARPEGFVATLTEKLLTFALGRGVGPDDQPAVRAIVRRVAEDDYRFSTLILAIASSPPFRLREIP